MARKFNTTTLVGIFILILLAVVYYYQEIRVVETEIPMLGVVIAREDIPENTVITEEMIFLEQRYKLDLLKEKGQITSNPEKIIGKRTIVPIVKNETIKLFRLVENKPYMNEQELSEKKQFAFPISNVDKSLTLKPGNFIDIWIEANTEGQMAGNKAKLFFLNKKIIEVKNEKYSTEDKETNINSYIIVHLTNEEIADYLNISKLNYFLPNIRVAAHDENLNYKITQNLINNENEKEGEKNDEINNN